LSYKKKVSQRVSSVNEIEEEIVLLIDENGVNQGEITAQKAFSYSKDKGLDLVKVQDGVFRLMDVSKNVYKKKKVQKKSHKATKTKEIRFKQNIAENDLNVKIKHINQFLSKGFRIKISFQNQKRSHLKIEDFLEETLSKINEEFTRDKMSKNENFCSINISPVIH